MLTGLGLGVGLMFLLDPAAGRRRRALVRDQLVHAARRAGDAAGATGRDMANRAAGVTARIRNTARQDDVADDVLIERVRAQLGHVVSHPRAIDVHTAGGVVTLRGPILQNEASRLCRMVERISGVREVVNELEEHAEASNIPALQGGSTDRPFWQRGWSPTTSVLTAVAAAAGLGLLARAAANRVPVH